MWHKAPCSSRDYSGVRESGPCKRDEDGDDGGDVDEDDHHGDDSPPDGTPVPPRERRRGSPPSPELPHSPSGLRVCTSSYVFDLSLSLSRVLSMARS